MIALDVEPVLHKYEKGEMNSVYLLTLSSHPSHADGVEFALYISEK